MSDLANFTDANWTTEVMTSPQPVLVDFWAEWCSPCKALVPALEAVAQQFAGKVRVGKMNVEENEHVPFQYNVTTLPTLILFKNGQVAEQRIGLMSKDALARLIQAQLG